MSKKLALIALAAVGVVAAWSIHSSTGRESGAGKTTATPPAAGGHRLVPHQHAVRAQSARVTFPHTGPDDRSNLRTMSHGEVEQVDDDVALSLDPGGGITIKAVTPEGAPVELSSMQARLLARAIVDLADRDDAD